MSNPSKQPFAHAIRAYPEKDISSLLNNVTSLTDLQALMSVISQNRDSMSIALKSLEHGGKEKEKPWLGSEVPSSNLNSQVF